MVNLEVEGLRVGSLHHSNVAARPLVRLGQSVGPPVRPVNLSAVHGDSERVRQILVSPQNLNQPRAIVLGGIYGIRPVCGITWTMSPRMRRVSSFASLPGVNPEDATL